MGTDAQRERARKLAQQLIQVAGDVDEGLLLRAQQIVNRLKTPMAMVLERVPGDSVVEKCSKIGITRQAYYRWLKGEYRPNLRQSKRLAHLTGLKVDQIFWKDL